MTERHTDRELLKLAAKAAGYAINATRQAARDRDYREQIGLWIPGESTCWNPLIDSGHALRLAVKLKFSIFADDDPKGPNRYTLVETQSGHFGATEDWTDDPYAATRRAIVRAAAALGDA